MKLCQVGRTVKERIFLNSSNSQVYLQQLQTPSMEIRSLEIIPRIIIPFWEKRPVFGLLRSSKYFVMRAVLMDVLNT